MTGATAPATGVSADRSAVLRRRVRLLVAVTISWNVIEAIVAITAGTIASSSALVGFGLDSVVEVASAVAISWQFAKRDHQAREKTALRIIAISFFALAAYVTVDAARALLGAGEADHSRIGITLAAVSLVVMPFLSWAERRTGRELGSASVVADSKQTLLCTYLSGDLLAGLVLNATLGWSWADPVAALVIAAVAVKEGRGAWQGDSCCAPASALLGNCDDTADGRGCSAGCADACCTPNPSVAATRLTITTKTADAPTSRTPTQEQS